MHASDHVELERQPLAVVLEGATWGNPVASDPAVESGLGALSQLHTLVDRGAALTDRETRQDRLPHPRAEGTSPRDLDGRGDRLGQIGEQRDHFGAGLEPVLGESWLRSVSTSSRPSAMQISASCAS